jgi:hypothetical protein
MAAGHCKELADGLLGILRSSPIAGYEMGMA